MNEKRKLNKQTQTVLFRTTVFFKSNAAVSFSETFKRALFQIESSLPTFEIERGAPSMMFNFASVLCDGRALRRASRASLYQTDRLTCTPDRLTRV